jgi:hypothetical protein
VSRRRERTQLAVVERGVQLSARTGSSSVAQCRCMPVSPLTRRRRSSGPSGRGTASLSRRAPASSTGMSNIRSSGSAACQRPHAMPRSSATAWHNAVGRIFGPPSAWCMARIVTRASSTQPSNSRDVNLTGTMSVGSSP